MLTIGIIVNHYDMQDIDGCVDIGTSVQSRVYNKPIQLNELDAEIY